MMLSAAGNRTPEKRTNNRLPELIQWLSDVRAVSVPFSCPFPHSYKMAATAPGIMPPIPGRMKDRGE